MADHLFVYGTLQSGNAHAVAHFLRREARAIGRGRVRGALYDLGGYPGAIFTPAAPAYVSGEIFALPPDAAPLLSVLDDYEGLADGHDRGDYRRILIAVSLIGGRKMTAWSYALAEAPRRARRIEGGDWLRFARHLRVRKA